MIFFCVMLTRIGKMHYQKLIFKLIIWIIERIILPLHVTYKLIIA